MAVALSMDDKMGDDSVMECVPEQGTVKAYTSWTSGMPNYGASREQVVRKMFFIYFKLIVLFCVYITNNNNIINVLIKQHVDFILI